MYAIARFLFEPREPLWRWCLHAFAYALIGSFTLITLAQVFAQAMGADLSRLHAPEHQPTLAYGFSAVVLGPAIETLMLVCALELLMTLFTSKVTAALLSAIVWGYSMGY